MKPQGIVVHSTGANNPNLKRYVDCPEEVGVNAYGNHWNTATPGGQEICVHAFIGRDKNGAVRVAEILPTDICCWGVGRGSKGSYNYDPPHIQFEICEDGLSDPDYYRVAFDVAAQYCAHLCKLYDLTEDQIVSHREAHQRGYGSNHSDPEHWMKRFGQTMDDFRKHVSQLLDPKTKEQEEPASSISAGDLVKIADNATYYNGKAVPAWVKAQNWYVCGAPDGDRVVIDKNEKMTNAICSPISARYLTVLKSAFSPKQESPIPYRVKVTADALNIRTGPGSNTAKTGCITDQGVYTVVAESAGPGASLWGKLKSGAGWIALDYAKRI